MSRQWFVAGMVPSFPGRPIASSPTLRTAAHLAPVGRPFAWTNEILPLRYGLQWGLLEFIARRSGAEHQLMRVFPPPDFDPALQRP
jgi:hypothetical protein